MLGSLARWLRLAGFDASYGGAVTGRALAGWARAESRWLLTRDRGLAAAAGPRAVLIRAAGLTGQIEELRGRLGIQGRPELYFTRCAECNGELAEVPREDVAGRVPPFVAAHAERFRGCPGCGRVYWAGTHVERISARLQELFPEP